MCLELATQPASYSKPKSKDKQYKVRWDKGRLDMYYKLSNTYLASRNYDCSYVHCINDCQSPASHRAAINDHYMHIVHALKSAERESIPRIPHGALKPFWNEFLDDLKQKSILWHNIWLNAGRPMSGLIFNIKSSARLRYRLAIKDAFIKYENRFNDELCNHFLNKNVPEFWKSWSKKMHNNITKDVHINGSSEESLVAEAFARNFQSVYFNSENSTSAKSEFEQLFTSKLSSLGSEKASIQSLFNLKID